MDRSSLYFLANNKTNKKKSVKRNISLLDICITSDERTRLKLGVEK